MMARVFTATRGKPCDLDDECAETGERWQYMGTWDGEHQFRHRHHPATGRREYVNFKDDYDFSAQARQQHERERAYYGDHVEITGSLGADNVCYSDADSGL